MKSFISVLLTVALLTTVLVGCKDLNTNDRDNPISEMYTLLSDKTIMENEHIKNVPIIPSKTITIFGNTHVFNYNETLRSKRWINNRLDYLARDSKTNELLCFASFDSKTGALMSYANVNAGINRAYQSEVNDKSSEAEFLAYAKKLVSQYTSIEGCEVEISTDIYEYDEEGDYYAFRRGFDGYVNNTKNISDFYAIYKFKFYKMIDGIRRFDTNVIEIHSTGEVYRLWFDMQDELYDDFADIEIDMDQAERLTKDTLAKFIPADSSVDIVPSLLATNDGILWLHLEVYVRFGEGTSGYTYVIQIANKNKA